MSELSGFVYNKSHQKSRETTHEIWCSDGELYITFFIQLFGERLSGKIVHTTILKGIMGYDQYTVPDTVAGEPTVIAFL